MFLTEEDRVRFLVVLFLIIAIGCGLWGAWILAIFFLLAWWIFGRFVNKYEFYKYKAMNELGFFEHPPDYEEDRRRIRMLSIAESKAKVNKK
jgi:hypothetical protein